MTRVARLAVTGYALACLLFVAGYALIPTRVTGGAGSVRCGTALHPDRVNEVRAVCPAIGRQRLEDTVIVTALFALVAAAPLPFHRPIQVRPLLRSLLTVAIVTFWLVGGLLAVLALTGAYGRPGR